jgi:hypothetical protein
MPTSLAIVPMTIREAQAFVDRVHRHHRAPRGARFALGLACGTTIVGVALVGRPVARGLDDGWTVEVLRVAVVDGMRNACSQLYGAAWRAARALGYRRAITYTLATEPGTSLRGAGWRCVGSVDGRSWSCPSRPRVDLYPEQAKLRWEPAA